MTERASGEIVDERSITQSRENLRRHSQKYPGATMAMEVGAHSPWTSCFLEVLGHEVLVANPRKMRAIFQNDRKCDLFDREGFRSSELAFPLPPLFNLATKK